MPNSIGLAAGALCAAFAWTVGAGVVESATREVHVGSHTILDKTVYGEVQGDIKTDKGDFRITGLTSKTDQPALLGSEITERLTIGEAFCLETHKNGMVRNAISNMLGTKDESRPEFHVYRIKDVKPGLPCDF